MDLLAPLEALAHTERAKLTLVTDCGRPRASWKQSGKAVETVESLQIGSLFSVCEVLLKRLGYGGLPTHDNLIERMTPGQKVRMRALIAEVQELKREIMAQTPIEIIEPDLAGPVSSLSGVKTWR